MALKKQYYSVDGELYGESDSSGLTVYSRDALGSVVALEDGAGNTVSRVEYKPFGDVRTYSGANPLASPRRFLWNGTWGYRFNERYRQYVSHYVRARHYSGVAGVWTSVDPLWPGEKAYQYVGGRPMVVVDPSGKQTLLSTACSGTVAPVPWTVTNCQQYSWCEQWLTSGLRGESAVIMQCIDRSTSLVPCENCETPLGDCKSEEVKFAEYWEVGTDGKICHGDCGTDPFKGQPFLEPFRNVDYFNWQNNCNGCKGSHYAEGVAKLFRKSDLPMGWETGFTRQNVGNTVTLPMSPVCPPYFFSARALSTVRKKVSCSIQCCGENTSFNCVRTVGIS